MKNDNVNHPEHYAESCSLECIDVMELVFGREKLADYCVINAFKYMWRWKNKNGKEDLEKAKWYLNRASTLNGASCQQIRYKLSTLWNEIMEGEYD